MASSAALLGGHLATFARRPPRRQPRRRSRRIAPAAFLGLGGKAARGGDASNSTSGVTLWGSPGSRSPLVDWYLHELDVPFDAKSPGDPNNPHPFGQIPALRDGDVEVWESGAILMYLADCYGGLDTPAKRADANKWVVWANASLDPVLFIENERGQVLDSGARRAESPKALTRLESVLAQREFLSGEAFGVADVAVASYLLFVPIFFADVSFARWPNTARYMGRCVVRPAYSKAFGGRTAAYLADRIESWVA
ncbi:glutathione s-transferase [Micromonas commoda]|jgi:glutathione S-transferase/alpha,alpha-trehalase|uniref:Glutathione s-transferase n=1 Tax=Micromonas commoda (strain RCC299 / NOUM17 / CCMP2709) TaxID=296587 RepID=C1DZ36_MICCC|nr:glutathione s-transferase [Micromonas commoda]ACO61538.1 glutathione s-transferase [Micromonas commoda]|eukprot:XP_002500280.1 glutathione s-transferase [Micromonas commoda]